MPTQRRCHYKNLFLPFKEVEEFLSWLPLSCSSRNVPQWKTFSQPLLSSPSIFLCSACPYLPFLPLSLCLHLLSWSAALFHLGIWSWFFFLQVCCFLRSALALLVRTVTYFISCSSNFLRYNFITYLCFCFSQLVPKKYAFLTQMEIHIPRSPKLSSAIIVSRYSLVSQQRHTN